MESFSEEEYPKQEITSKIIGAAFRVHNQLGSGFVEKVYENALAMELTEAGVKVQRQKKLKIVYGGQSVGEYSADLLIEDEIVIELKAVKRIEVTHEEKLLHYLKASGLSIGLLLNFGSRSVQIRRKIYTPHPEQPSQPT